MASLPDDSDEQSQARPAVSGASDAAARQANDGRGTNAAPWMRLAGSGIELAASTLLLGAAGYWLDSVVGSRRPYFAVAGVLLGFSVGLYRLIVLAIRPIDGRSGRARDVDRQDDSNA